MYSQFFLHLLISFLKSFIFAYLMHALILTLELKKTVQFETSIFAMIIHIRLVRLLHGSGNIYRNIINDMVKAYI